MPALIHFQRKWLLACDDLVIPYAIETPMRAIWLCGTFFMAWQEFFGSGSSLFIRYFLYAYISHLLLTTFLCIVISVISGRGSVLQTHKRTLLSKILYAKFATVFCDLAIGCYLVWLLLDGPSLSSEWKIFLEAASVCHLLYVLGVIIGYFLCYNSLGSSLYWNNNNRENSIQIFKKAERIWRLRLKFFCCCADVSEDENDFIYVEIATFLATFSSDIDLAPTDILAGLITISKKHDIERRRINCHQIKSDVLLENKPLPFWMTAENALYYLRIAKSTYGWLAFFDILRPCTLCTLLSPSRILKSFSQENTEHGDCCYCNSTAVEKISGLPDSDIMYASFSNSIHEPAFVITTDHAKKSIIIAIRGTRSFSDLITDINGEEMSFPEEISSQKLQCHRGALRSALFIFNKIHELNILKIAFTENPSYELVLTGHSLGGSIAAILGLLLHPQYPTLQCYSYAPLAVLSAEGIPKSIDFVFSVVVGDDMVPRLSVHSCKELFKQLYKSLEETELPKYKILTKAFWKYIKKSLKISRKALPISQIHDNQQVQVEDLPPEQIQINISTNEAQLYAPGRILHLKRAEGCDYSWVTGYNFQNILISPYIIKDHQPHQIQHFLDKYKNSIANPTSNEIFSIRL